MAKYLVSNKLGSKLGLPSPLNVVLGAHRSVSLEAEPGDFNSAAVKDLVARGIIDVVLQNDPETPDAFEGASLEGVGLSFSGNLATSNATPGAIATLAVPTDSIMMVEAKIMALEADGTGGSGFVIVGSFRNDGGTVSQIGATAALVTQEDDAATAVAFAVSGTNVLINVTGIAATEIRWRAAGSRHLMPL